MMASSKPCEKAEQIFMSEESKTHSTEESRAHQPSYLTRIWFEELGLPAHVLAGLKNCGFTLCTPLQSQVIPLAFAGKDVIAQAGPGSGKIAAYLLPLLSRLPDRSGKAQENASALIIVPTPELAQQVGRDINLFSTGHSVPSHAVIVDTQDHTQGEPLLQGTDIVIGTPSALVHHVRQGTLKLFSINVLVIDEADRFFHLGLAGDLRYLLRKLPHSEKRRSILFSNVISYRILALAYHYLNLPEFVSGIAEETQLTGMEQTLFHVDSQEKASLLLGILKREEWRRVLIFTNTQESAEKLSQILKGNGFPIEEMTADMPQRKRFRLMVRLNRGSARILVTTDSASGALYAESISHVINYDLPLQPQVYIQRAGRISAENGRRRVISFACEEYVFHLEPIQEALGYKIPVTLPHDDWFAERKDLAPKTEQAQKPQETHEEKRPLQLKGGARVVFSSSPGGVFGLAPERIVSSEQGMEGKKKTRRRRPRRSPQKE